MFMTCSTSYCLVTLKDLWNVYMYVCMNEGDVCMTRNKVSTLTVQVGNF